MYDKKQECCDSADHPFHYLLGLRSGACYSNPDAFSFDDADSFDDAEYCFWPGKLESRQDVGQFSCNYVKLENEY